MLLICDMDGRVQAVSSARAMNDLLVENPLQRHFAEVFGTGSEIAKWITKHIDEARSQDLHRLETLIEHRGKRLAVSLEGLKNEKAVYGFAVELIGDSCDEALARISEGDAVVTRQQWHDIKNQLGGLKLYATFLNRKLPPSEEQQTVERMLNGINVLIEHLAKIRRGESQ